MKTLLQINSVVNLGSTGRIAEEIGQVAISNGWNSYIAFSRNEQSSKSKLIKIGTDCDVNVHGFKTRLFDRHGFGSRKATEKLIVQIDKINPDIIHLHNLHGYYLNIEVLFQYLALKNISIVWTLYDCWALTGHCTYFDQVKCNRWENGCYDCPQKSTYPASWLIDNSKNNYNLKSYLFNLPTKLTIVVHSKWLFDIVKKSFLNKIPIKLINNGINLSKFRPRETEELRSKFQLNEKFIILGVANRWEKRKGFDDFIKLSKLIPENVAIILDGVDKKRIKTLPSNIFVHERAKSIDELATLYSLADVFINPTYEDNFPTTNLEALACGTPVITYNTGGSPESIDLNTGLVVEKGDIEGLVRSVLKIREKGKYFYSKKCIAQAKSKFNYLDRYKDYIFLFENLIS